MKDDEDWRKISDEEEMAIFQQIVEITKKNLESAGIFNSSSLPPVPY